jgi:hypothetical protein
MCPAKFLQKDPDMMINEFFGTDDQRAVLRRGRAMAAVLDHEANVVACAVSSAFAHAGHARYGQQAWWGMLATHPERRGHRLSLILGAHALIDMETRFGFQAFMTGVEPCNAPSEAVCTRAGMSPGEFAIIACADPHALASGRMTK